MMIKELIAGILIALLPITATAHAAPQKAQKQRAVVVRTYLPPKEYDEPYTGQLEIQRYSSSAELLRLCKGKGVGLACAPHTADLSKCWIWIATDDIIKKRGYTLATILRHELGHCNGWGADHKPDGRIVDTDSIKEMPSLPEGTRWLTLSPPVVCLTPEWKPELCANRSVDAVMVGGDYGIKGSGPPPKAYPPTYRVIPVKPVQP